MVPVALPPCADSDSGSAEQAELVDEELHRIRAALEDLRAEYRALADPDNVALDDEHDSEGSTVGFERARVAGLIARMAARADSLESARARSVNGTYGSCCRCGAPIGAERLEALPGTQVCIGCARRPIAAATSTPPEPSRLQDAALLPDRRS